MDAQDKEFVRKFRAATAILHARGISEPSDEEIIEASIVEGHSDNMEEEQSLKLSMEIETELQKLILADNTILSSPDEFLQTLNEGLKNSEYLISLILSSEWKCRDLLRNFVLINIEGSYRIDIGNLDRIIKSVTHMLQKKPIIDQGFDSSRDSSFSSVTLPSEYGEVINRGLRSSAKKIDISNIRGLIRTYEKKMMGGFNCIYKDVDGDHILYIEEDVSILRPTGVTGNISSRRAGNHVVPISLFIKHIVDLVKGESVYRAIEALIEMISKFDVTIDEETSIDPYQSIIEDAKPHLAKLRPATITIDSQLAAFQFLKSNLIPHIVAVWNQKPGRSFLGKRTEQELLEEARKVKIGNQQKDKSDSTTVNVKVFVEMMVDYQPIDESASDTSSTYQDKFLKGIRTNSFTTLAYIIGEIVEEFISHYALEALAPNYMDIIKNLVQEILVQKGWLKYYQNNPKEIESYIKVAEVQLEEYLTDLVISNIKKDKVLLFADFEVFSEDSFVDSGEEMSISSHETYKPPRKKNKSNGIDDYYTEDQISTLLTHFLPESDFYVAPQTQLEDQGLLRSNLNAAIAEALGGKPAVMNINLHGNHWVGVIIRKQGDGNIQVIYVDSLGGRIETESNAGLLIQTITVLVSNAHIVDLGTGGFIQQHNAIDCGPFTVANLVSLAQAGYQLDSLNATGIIDLGVLSKPDDGSASTLRQQHSVILGQSVIAIETLQESINRQDEEGEHAKILFVTKIVYNNKILNDEMLLHKVKSIANIDIITKLIDLGNDQEIAEQILLAVKDVGIRKVLEIFFGDKIKSSASEVIQIQKRELPTKTQSEYFLETIAKIETFIGKEALVELIGWHQYISKALSNNPLSEHATKVIQTISNLTINLEEWLDFSAIYEDIEIDNQVAIILSQLEGMFDFIASGVTHVGCQPRYPDFDLDDYYGGGSNGGSNGVDDYSAEKDNIDFSSLFVGQNTTTTNGTDY
jgi:hypothetical protein